MQERQCKVIRENFPTSHYQLNLQPLPIKMPKEADDKRQAAREVIDILQEISDLLVRTSLWSVDASTH